MCRQPFSPSILKSTENYAISEFLRKMNPDYYKEKDILDEKYRSMLSSNENYIELPIFFLPLCLFPDQPLELNIFEDRYLVLIERCLAGDKKFMILNSGSENTIGSIVKIDVYYPIRPNVLYASLSCVSRCSLNGSAYYKLDTDREVTE
jgi:hypothetical protein